MADEQQKRQQIQNPGQTRHHRSEKIGRHHRQSHANAPPPRPPSLRRTRSRPSPRPPSTSRSASSSRVSDRVSDLVEPWTDRSQRRETAQDLPHAAAQNAEADRAPRHQRPPQGDHRGPQDPQPGRARGPQAPAHGRDDAEAQPQRGRVTASAARSTSRPPAPRVWSTRSRISSPRCARPARRPSQLRAPRAPARGRSSSELPAGDGDGPRGRRARRASPRGRRDVGAELEADAAAVVVAERVGVAEAAAGVGLRRCGTPSRRRRGGGTAARPAGRSRDRRVRGADAAAEDDRRAADPAPCRSRRAGGRRRGTAGAAPPLAPRVRVRVPAKTTSTVAARPRGERGREARRRRRSDRRSCRWRGSAPAAKVSTTSTGRPASGAPAAPSQPARRRDAAPVRSACRGRRRRLVAARQRAAAVGARSSRVDRADHPGRRFGPCGRVGAASASRCPPRRSRSRGTRSLPGG